MCFWSEKIKTGQNALSVIISTIVKRPQIFLLWSEFQKTVFSSETSCNNIDLWFYFFVSGFLLLPQSHVEWNECDELPPSDWRKDLCQLMVLIGSNDYSETCCLLLRSRRKKGQITTGCWMDLKAPLSSSPRLLFSCGGINSSCCLFWKIEMERILYFRDEMICLVTLFWYFLKSVQEWLKYDLIFWGSPLHWMDFKTNMKIY